MKEEKECLFCAIASGSVKADIVYRDGETLAFRDVDPKAPDHVLIIPLKHIGSLGEMPDEDSPLMGKIIVTAKKVARKLSLESYRLVINNGKDAGQSVFHLHAHLLGGRLFGWPPG
ncbi:MAG: histidine triad nucleotide-binding protein [Elusimicrobia bacterium CG03_land_8_20_14_0_80_50_18]|nr:MAG: histidine triad nucleotide-binding protein [Elusimicrobia bacterium CG03_land_8_20_14_0_80_50_18]PIX15608.1 MAG: histidine triad nucleotide-binding protein [Elusimicrobia bacterium CG_4_8_14_3_um_filter_50_9]